MSRLSVSETAAFFGVKRWTIYRWLQAGILPASLARRGPSGRMYFWREELEDYEQRLDAVMREAVEKVLKNDGSTHTITHDRLEEGE